MARILASFWIAVLLMSLSACKAAPKATPDSGPAASAPDTGPTSPGSEATAAAPKETSVRPKSAHADLREAISDYVTLLADCDRRWFSDVKPERIDKWELPVSVMEMEKMCDRLLPLFDTLVEKAVFKGQKLDDFLRDAALSADRYIVLAFRCKKVGVKDKIPFKKEIEELRDALRADVAKLKESVGPVLEQDDAALVAYATAPADEQARIAHAALTRLREDLKTWVEAPLKDAKPTWRYSLRTTLASAKAAAMAIQAGPHAQTLGPAADGLVKAFDAAVVFYTGNYFDAEEKEGPKVRGAVVRADAAYRAAARKVFKK